MKLNHFVCPTCGRDWYDSCAYSTCDACQTTFYLAQSAKPQFKSSNTFGPDHIRLTTKETP